MLALSHPVCVGFDAYGGSGADTCSRTRRHSDRTIEPFVTSPLHPRAHHHNAAQCCQSATGLSTEFDDVLPVEETHTYNGDESVELADISQPVSNRFVLQLTSIAEESERSTDVCYNVEDIFIGTRDVLRDHLAAACAHELHVTRPEWGTVTTHLSTIDKPRRRTNEHKSEIGESRSSESYSHNTGFDERQ